MENIHGGACGKLAESKRCLGWMDGLEASVMKMVMQLRVVGEISQESVERRSHGDRAVT